MNRLKRSKKQNKKRSRRQNPDGRAIIDTSNTLEFENIRDIFHSSQFIGTVPINSFSYYFTFYRVLREFCDNTDSFREVSGLSNVTIILLKYNGIVYVINRSSSPPKKYAVICNEHEKEIPITYETPPTFSITVPAYV